MDIVKELRKEEAKLEKSAKHALKRLEALRSSIKLFATGLIGNGRLVKKRRKKSAATRAKMAKAQKARWAKVRASKAKAA